MVPTDHELECCEVGDYLADNGLANGTWQNHFVAAMARELLAARKKLAQFGMKWNGEDFDFK